MRVFAKNLRELLMAPPLGDISIIAVQIRAFAQAASLLFCWAEQDDMRASDISAHGW